MARLLSIDYGLKRTGIAVTDPLQLIAHALTTVETKMLQSFLVDYLSTEAVDKIIVGQPKQVDFTASEIEPAIRQFIAELKKKLPNVNIERFGEQYTSQRAMQSLLQSGVKKKERRDKALLDQVSATIILQGYMEAHSF